MSIRSLFFPKPSATIYRIPLSGIRPPLENLHPQLPKVHRTAMHIEPPPPPLKQNHPADFASASPGRHHRPSEPNPENYLPTGRYALGYSYDTGRGVPPDP